MSALLLALLSACSVPVLTEQCPDGCDRDGDGWIDAADGGWDCDDQDPSRHPGMSEICNLRDDDCDGAIDDADPSLDRSTACNQLGGTRKRTRYARPRSALSAE